MTSFLENLNLQQPHNQMLTFTELSRQFNPR